MNLPGIHNSFILNNRTLKSDELIELIVKKINSSGTVEWEKGVLLFIQEWIDGKKNIEVQTSGSAGTPKTISLKKEWMQYSAVTTCNYLGIKEGDTALLCIPAQYIGGKMMIVRAMTLGLNLILREPSGNPFSDLTQPVDFAAITPYQLHQSFQFLQKLPVVKTLIVGGGEINPELEKQIDKLPVKVYSTYGMTETSSHVALRRVNGPEKTDCYTTIGNTALATDERGCLVMENPMLFNGKLVTNDLVEILDDKRFIWKGRYDNIINSGGVKLLPEKIEKTIAHLIPGKFIVIGMKDEKLGHALTLVIEKESAGRKNDADYFRKSLSTVLSGYELPRNIVFVDKIPTTENGKPDRRAAEKLLIRN